MKSVKFRSFQKKKKSFVDVLWPPLFFGCKSSKICHKRKKKKLINSHPNQPLSYYYNYASQCVLCILIPQLLKF